MRVVLSTWGRFHFFHLARQLHRRRWLETIFTTYPRFKLRDEKLPLELIQSDGLLETFLLGKARFGLSAPWLDPQLERLKQALHDRFMLRRMPACDLFIALSGSGAVVGQSVQERGGRYICDRGSTHVAYGDDLMADEFRRWNLPFRRTHPAFIERECVEYDIADRIVVPSSVARRSYIERGVPAAKLEVIGFGAELSRFKRLADPPQDEFVVLFVGAIKFRKGVPYLLEAFRRLRHPKKRLMLVGSVTDEIRGYLRTAPLDRVELTGIVPNTQLAELMSRSHVMVLPSLEEGMALVQAEAMACGCPVIATTNTGAEDLFTDGTEGFIVPIRDPDAIADRLQQIADDPSLRERLSAAAMARIHGMGGWNDYGDRYAALCQALMDEKAIASPPTRADSQPAA